MQNYTGGQMQAAGQALQHAGFAAMEIGNRLQVEIDVAGAKEGDALAADRIDDRLRGVEGYLRTKGKAAIDGYEPFRNGLNKLRDELLGSLGNAGQRELAEPMIRQRIRTALRHADTHVADQIGVYTYAQTKARADAFRMEYRDAETDEDAKVARAMFYTELAEIREQRGLDPDSYKALLHEETDRLHAERIDRLIETERVEAASDYLAQHEDQLTTKQHAVLRARVKHANVVIGSAQLADVIYRKIGNQTVELPRDGVRAEVRDATGPGGSALGDLLFTTGTWRDELADAGQPQTRPLTPEEWKAQARADLDARFAAGKITREQRAATWDILRAEYGREREAYVEQTAQVQASAEQFLADNPNLSLSHLPPSLLAEVRERGLERELRTFAQSGRYQTDPAIYDAFMAMSREQMAARSEADWRMSLRGHLNNSDLRTVLATYRSKVTEAKPEDRRYLTNQQRMERLARQLGKLPTDRQATTEERNAYTDWIADTVEPALIGRQQQIGRDLSDAEVKEVLDGIAREELLVRQDGWVWDSVEPKPLAAIPPEEIGDAFVQINGQSVYLREVPRDVLQVIAGVLVDEGVDAGPTAIINRWVRMGRPQSTTIEAPDPVDAMLQKEAANRVLPGLVQPLGGGR